MSLNPSRRTHPSKILRKEIKSRDWSPADFKAALNNAREKVKQTDPYEVGEEWTEENVWMLLDGTLKYTGLWQSIHIGRALGLSRFFYFNLWRDYYSVKPSEK